MEESDVGKLKMNQKNATKVRLSEKQINNTSQKHSTPFYISPSLFNNKRLKDKRHKWAAFLKAAANRKETKTDRRKQDLSKLCPDVTIDLLSDDGGDNSNTQRMQVQHITQPQNLQQQFYVLPGQLDLAKVANITLIPVQNIAIPKLIKRKRKSQQPKRHAQPTIVNSESIVLSDDSDTEQEQHLSPATPMASLTSLPNRTSTPIENHPLPPQPPIVDLPEASSRPIRSAQVDEEVTVSIVPRSSTAGNCSKSIANELFPMLPDETTVHTVIANRTYELSLTKLREGLASCGIPEFANGAQKISPTRRKGKVDTPPVATPPPTAVSLKLSSDLSISLISDEEDGDQQQQQQVNAEILLQKQPQLSIQQLQRPVVNHNSRQPPRLGKLG